uniref:C2H2-type domain-containing protein n=1 Tax=viral metagenome TaxID=1070528 RepID=A0A6C0CYY3_9ZZZZ
MECEYCKKNFKSVSNLNNHQKTAKYCLIKRGLIKEDNSLIIEEYNCKYCDKLLSTKYTLNSHIESCSKYYESQLNEKDKQLQEQRKEYEQKILEQRKDYERQITELKTQIREKDDIIASIAAQPKNITTHNNNRTNNNNNSRVNVINNLVPMTDDEYKKLGDMLQRSHLERGVDGFADLAIQFFQDKAVCTDLSRRMVTHKDAEGRVVSDPNMTRLTTKFFGGLMDKNHELTLEILTDLDKRRENKEIDFDEFMNILVRFSDQKFNVRKLADGDEKNEPTDEKGEYLQFKNTYVNKVCDKIYVKNI